MQGRGELASLVLSKAALRLRTIEKKMAGKGGTIGKSRPSDTGP